MDIQQIIQRNPNPRPWSEGEKIPWDEPGFSRRMLREHLSQEHDAASRRFETIDRHVDWIHNVVLAGRPSRLLDLGCGPGLYSSRLATLGHTCHGIDFSPASIEYAVENAPAGCTYMLDDLRKADFGAGYDLALFIYGELNAFRTRDVQAILRKAHAALKPGGQLLLEVSTFDSIRQQGNSPVEWSTEEAGLFSDQPHLVLHEAFWDQEEAVATNRWFIVDAATGSVTRYIESLQAYTDEQYRALLKEAGFRSIVFYPSLTGEQVPPGDLLAILAGK